MTSLTVQDENTSLLKNKNIVTPLPKILVTIPLLYVFADGLVSAYIFSFLPFMIQHFFHFSDKSRIGYYAGFVGCVMEIARFLGSPSWTMLSDKIGLKPVIMLTLFLNVGCLLSFGFASSFEAVVFARFLQGICCGRSVAKAYLANLSDATNEAIIFSLYAMSWSLGDIFGPVLGGFLWNPAIQFPSYFSPNSFLGEYPNLLPSLIIASIEFLNFFLSWQLLVEDPHSAATIKKLGSPIPVLISRYDRCSGCYAYLPNISSYLTHFRNPIIRRLFCLTAMTALAASAFDTSIPVFSETPLIYGGLGFDPKNVGTVQAICGVVSFFCLFLHWYLLQLFGALRVFQLAIGAFATSFLWPVLITSMNWQANTQISFRILVVMYTFRAAAYGALFLSLNILAKNTVDPSQVAGIMGIFGSATAVGMACGPYGTSALYAWSIGPSAEMILPTWLMQGRFAFLLLVMYQMCILGLSFKLKGKQI